jgi:hypothetical protein
MQMTQHWNTSYGNIQRTRRLFNNVHFNRAVSFGLKPHALFYRLENNIPISAKKKKKGIHTQQSFSFSRSARFPNSENKVDNNSRQQGDSKHRWSKAVIKPALSTLPYTLRSPMKGKKRINHGGHGDDGEQAGRDAANAVAEIQKTDGEAAENDGEVKPWEKGSFIGEEDLGLNTSGEGDALAWFCDLISKRWDGGDVVICGVYREQSEGEAAKTWCSL